jgi:hypothetical protein
MTDTQLKEWMETQYDLNDNGCWIWRHGKNPYGYGIIRYKRKDIKVHRLYWVLSGNPLQEDLHILHGKGCSTSCFNPEHLTVGGAQQNALDRHRDGTMRQAKLTREQVLDIRSRVGKTHKELAEEFGISRQQMSRIVSGERWKWV